MRNESTFASKSISTSSSEFFHHITTSSYTSTRGCCFTIAGAALNQSPVGLAAYILEKFSTWTHKNNLYLPDGGLLQQDFPISLDSMLDNICIYWYVYIFVY